MNAGYSLAEARLRAGRRHSKWNLLLIPSCSFGVGVTWFLLAKTMTAVHGTFYPSYPFGHTRTNLGGCLLYVPLLFPSFPIGMMLGNLLIWYIVPARRALDQEAEGVWHASFTLSMRDLTRVTAWLLPIALAFSLLGAIDPF